MTAFNNNIVNNRPNTAVPMSELLQNHLKTAGVSVASMPMQNTPPQSILTQMPDKYDGKAPKSHTKSSKGKKAKIAGASLGTVLALTILSLVISPKSRSQNGITKKLFSKFAEKADSFIHELSKDAKSRDIQKNLYILRKKTQEYGNSVENIVNGKDVLTRAIADKITGKNINPETAGEFQKFYKRTFGKFFSKYYGYDAATMNLYKGKGLGKLTGLYKKAQTALEESDTEILNALKKLEDTPRANLEILYNGQRVKIKNVIPEIKDKIAARQVSFAESFTTEKVAERVDNFDKYLVGDENGRNITEKTKEAFIQKIKDRKFGELFTDPIARGLIQDKKVSYTSSVRKMRDGITSNLGTTLDNLRESFDGIRNGINPEDVDSIYKYNETMRAVEKYKRTIAKKPKNTYEIQTKICNMLNDLETSLQTFGGSDDAIKTLNNIKTDLNNIKDGQTEEILSALEKVLDADTYTNIAEPKIRQAQKALNKAYSMEVNDTIDKLRDINCGSAATDFLTLITSTGLLGLYTAQAENGDERVSIGLTTGLPILTTVAVNLYGAINQISGKKSMAFSLLTGFITKIICDNLDKGYKKLKGLDENTKPSITTIDDYIKHLDPYKNQFEDFFMINAGLK